MKPNKKVNEINNSQCYMAYVKMLVIDIVSKLLFIFLK